MMAAIVHLDPDMMSGIQEINNRTNDSSPAAFQAPLHQRVKGNPVKAMTSRIKAIMVKNRFENVASEPFCSNGMLPCRTIPIQRVVD
jgi:hypothetical protein